MGDDRENLPVQARLKSSELSVGQLARMTGVRSSAIRYYEACGLLPAPERRSGKRLYRREGLARLKAIIAARHLGFSIGELKQLASAGDGLWRAAARTKAASVKLQIEKLSAAARRLEDLSGCDCENGRACHL